MQEWASPPQKFKALLQGFLSLVQAEKEGFTSKADDDEDQFGKMLRRSVHFFKNSAKGIK